MPYNSKKGAFKLVQSESEESLYGILAIINDSQEEINETINFDKLDGFTLWGPHSNQKQVVVKCPAKQFYIILLHRKGETKASFKFSAMMPAKKKTGGAFGGMMAGMPAMGGGMAGRVSPR